MVETHKDKYNRKYGFPKGTAHSVADIAKTTGFKKSHLDIIIKKGLGAFYSNPASVRPSVTSPQQWSKARLYSAVTGGKASKVDAKHLIKS
jgi:hypothetical protein